MNDFGAYVADARKKLGLSQKDLASRILKEDGTPISLQYLNDIEHGRRNPPPAYYIRQLASQLGVAEAYLSILARQLPQALQDLETIQLEPDAVEKGIRAFRRAIEKKNDPR